MRNPVSAGVLVVALGLVTPLVAVQQTTAPPAAPLSPTVLAKLPPDWREPAAAITATESDQQRFVTVSDEAFRVALARLLVRQPSADAFVKTKLVNDPAPAVRRAIVQTIGNDTRWLSLPDTAALIEGAVARDPDATVSLAALEALRRFRMRGLNTLLNERAAAARQRGDDNKALAQLAEEQERWLALERGTMLPAFLRT